jgi:lysophospholipase L1-like esterase
VEQCQARGVKVLILTATVIGEELDKSDNKKLAAYNDFLRKLAKEKKCPLADLNAMFQKTLKAKKKPDLLLTVDGVHMNPAGDLLMAEGVLKAFGLTNRQIKKAEAAPAAITK